MEQKRKNLKIASGLVLLFAGLTLVQIIASLVFSPELSMVPEGTSEDLVLIAKIFVAVIALLLLAPQVYVGVRGFQLAKKPGSIKAPLVWAVILLFFYLFSLVSPLIAVIQQNNARQNVSTLLSVIVDVLIYVDYIKCLRELKKAE